MIRTIILSLILACCFGGQSFAQYQWGRLDMFGTNAYEVTMHIDGSILAATSGGIYRSTDNGEHWNQCHGGLELLSFPSFTNIGTTFDLAGNSYIMARLFINGLYYRSADNGATWQEASDSLDYIHKGITARLTTQNNTLLVGVYDSGIWRSTNNGVSYESVLSTTYNTPMVLTQTASGTLFVGGENGQVFSSSDDGQTWMPYAVPGTESITSTQLLVDGKELLFLAAKSLYRSTDGIQWTENALSDSIIIGTATLSPAGDIVASVRNEAGAERIGHIIRGGKELIISGQGLTYFPISNISAGANGWFIAAKGGIQRSTDHGATWQKNDRGIYNNLRSVLSLEDGTTVLNSFYDLYKYDGTDVSVHSVRAGLPLKDIGGMYQMTITKKGTILITAGDNGFYRSTDHGATFQNIPHSGFVAGICIRSNGEILATINNEGTLVSRDDGKTWSGGIQFPSNVKISVLDDVKESQNGAIFISSLTFGYIIRVDANMKDALILTNPETSHPGTDLLLVQDDIYVIDDYSHILRGNFTDGTMHWTEITPPAITTKNSIGNLALGPNGEIFCASDFGLYRTSNRGETWQAAGWQDGHLSRVCIDKKGRIYVNVRDSGAYTAQLPTGIADPAPAPVPMALMAPNPAFDHTQLHFATSHAARVRVLLYNALGQEAMIVADSFEPAGEQTISINTSLLAPGFYKYRVQAGAQTLTGSLTVVR